MIHLDFFWNLLSKSIMSFMASEQFFVINVYPFLNNWEQTFRMATQVPGSRRTTTTFRASLKQKWCCSLILSQFFVVECSLLWIENHIQINFNISIRKIDTGKKKGLPVELSVTPTGTVNKVESAHIEPPYQSETRGRSVEIESLWYEASWCTEYNTTN